jgi:hypothetical protein
VPLLSEHSRALLSGFDLGSSLASPPPGIFRMIVKLKMLRELAFWKCNEGKDLVFLEHLEHE